MLSETELIKFILKHSSDYSEEYLKTLSIQSLVILKVEIEVKLSKRDDEQNGA